MEPQAPRKSGAISAAMKFVFIGSLLKSLLCRDVRFTVFSVLRPPARKVTVLRGKYDI